MGKHIESLENRRLLAAYTGVSGGTVTIDGSTIHLNETLGPDGFPVATQWSSSQFHITKRGTLVIEGSDGGDWLSVVRKDGNVTLAADWRNPQITTAVPNSDKVRRVLVEANGGDDRIDVSGFDGPATVAGGTGNDDIWGGRRQQLIGGAGNDFLMATAAYNLPEAGNDTGQGTIVDPHPMLLSGGAGRDTLVAAGGAADSLVGGEGVDRLFCTAVFTGNETLTGQQARDLLVQQDAATLSGVESIQMSPRRASTVVPKTVFNSPFGLVGSRSFAAI